MKRGKGFAASVAQRAKVQDLSCLVCARDACHPAHLVDKSLWPDLDGDPRRVVPLCPFDHREYDDGHLDLLPYLEPRYREELAFAVAGHGLIRTLKRVTNCGWVAA